MNIKLKSIVAAIAFAASCSAFAADPIKIGVSGPYTGGSSPMGVSMRDGVKTGDCRDQCQGRRSGTQDRAGRARRPGRKRARRAGRAGTDQQGKCGRHGGLHQYRRFAGFAAFLPGSQDPGDQQRRHRLARDQAVPAAGIRGQLHLPQCRQRHHPVRDDRQEAIDVHKYTKVAILADSTNYGQLGRADLEKALAAKGIKPVAVEKFNIKDVDMTAQLLKAKEAGAQAILTYAHRTRVGADRQRHEEAGLEGADDRKLDAVHG